MSARHRLLMFAAVHCAAAMAAVLVLPACGAPTVSKPTPKPVAEKPVDPWGPRPTVAAITGSGFATPERLVVSGGSKQAANRPGVELLVVERHDAPAVFFRWVLPGGRAVAFSGGDLSKPTRWPEGTLDFTARMLTEGTRRHRSSAFAAALERHGATLDFDVGPDAIVISGRVLSHQLEPYLGLLAEALTQPEFSAKAAGNLRTRYLAALANVEQQPRQVVGRVVGRLLHGPLDAYGSPGLGLDTVPQVATRDMRRAMAEAFRLGGSTLIAVGDVTSGDLAQKLRQAFGKHLDSAPAAVELPAAVTLERAGCHVVDVPGAVQTAVIEANLGPGGYTDERPQLVLANQILGGSASSRLFTVLRERKGLTYGIYSDFDMRQRAGDWSVTSSVRTEKTAAALEAIRTEVRLMRSTAPKQLELNAARQFLAGQFVMSQASGAAVAHLLARLRIEGLADDTWQRWLGSLQEVDPAKVRQAAENWIGSGRRVTVLAGSLVGMRPAIDAHCSRLLQRDARGQLLRPLIADDAEMSSADRTALFSVWASAENGLVPLTRFVKNSIRLRGIRADAVMALLGTAAQDKMLSIGAQATDWPGVAEELALRLVAALASDEVARASSAKTVLLDLLAPPAGATPLSQAAARAADKALAAWAFAGISPHGESSAVRKIMATRLIEADLSRLGPAAIDGLEALISTDVWRTTAAKALVAGDEGAARALVRAYRRSLVERRAPANDEDLALIAQSPGHGTALLLLDAHAIHQASDKPELRRSVAATMTTLRGIIDQMAATASREPKDRQAGRSALNRDFPILLRAIERVLTFRNADDRWWAAGLIIRNLGSKGLRLVLDGLADDVGYAAPGWHEIDPRQSIGDLCRNDIAPLGADTVRAAMLARLHRPHRIVKAVAVTCLKALGDPGSMDALRTTHDKTDVGPALGLVGVVTVSQLARSAVAVRAYMAEVDATVAAGKLDRRRGAIHKDVAYYTFDKSGEQLRHMVALEVARRAPPPPPPKAQPRGAKIDPKAGKKGAAPAKDGAP